MTMIDLLISVNVCYAVVVGHVVEQHTQIILRHAGMTGLPNSFERENPMGFRRGELKREEIICDRLQCSYRCCNTLCCCTTSINFATTSNKGRATTLSLSLRLFLCSRIKQLLYFNALPFIDCKTIKIRQPNIMTATVLVLL